MESNCNTVLNFRGVSKYDVIKLQSLYEECFPVSYPASWFQDLLNNSNLISIVAVSDDDLVGILVGTVTTLGCCGADDRRLLASSFPLSTSVAYILSLGVTSSFRSKGVASLLLRSFIGYVSGENMDWLTNCDHQVDFPCSNISTQTVKMNINDCNNEKYYCYSERNVSLAHRTTTPITSRRIKDYHSLYNLLTQLPRVSPVRAVYLHVLHSNLHARRFYENRGFICLHTRRGCYTINGKLADGCTYVLHTNGGYFDKKSTNYNLNTVYEYFIDHSLVCYIRWIIRVISQSGHNIFYKLSRVLHHLYDIPSTFLHSYAYQQSQQYDDNNHSLYPSSSFSMNQSSECFIPQDNTSTLSSSSSTSSYVSVDSVILSQPYT
ncbi:hypothetical protein MN116_007655 [Schistosoma mekongi]|uniref:N-alpha-acetyltransferase 60 n=1 Tax=Schistosoma mekongi TaxID=38744 RepID=A0AAE1Z7C4_SCHME|nr:hypothetical protein MN116_007655 [Schistosoma mekongi]